MRFSTASDAFPLAFRCGGPAGFKKNQRKEREREEKPPAALIHAGPWLWAPGSVRSQAGLIEIGLRGLVMKLHGTCPGRRHRLTGWGAGGKNNSGGKKET